MMNKIHSYEFFQASGPIGGGGAGPIGGGGAGPIGGGGAGPIGGGPIGGRGGPVGGGGPIGGAGPRPLGPLGHGRHIGMDHHRYYHHPKPRYHYNYYPYYYYPYNYYYYPVVTDNDQDICFCTNPKYDDQNEQKVCVDGTCGVCISRSLCSTCDEKITCKKQD